MKHGTHAAWMVVKRIEKCWLPLLALGFGALCLGWQGQLHVNVSGAMLAGLALVGWLWGKRLYSQGLVALALVSALVWQGPWATWRAWHALQSHPPLHLRLGQAGKTADEGQRIWVEGRLVQRTFAEGKPLKLLLTQAHVHWKTPSHGMASSGGWVRHSMPLAELVVMVRSAGKNWKALRLNRQVQMGGVFLGARTQGALGQQQLIIQLGHAAFHHALTSQGSALERMRLQLAARSAFWLSPKAYALFGPLVLGIKQANSQSRHTVAVFRRLGAAHIFAISGLHVGLLLGFGLLLIRFLGYWPAKARWIHRQSALHMGLLGLLWFYIALIGFPIPAVRAGFMASMWMVTRILGLRIGVFHLLFFTALLMLSFTPGDVHSLSFRLSFVAYAMLIVALRVPPPGMAWLGRQRLLRFGQSALWSLWLTAFILLGMLPLLANTFGRVSLAAFVANLVLVPPLGLLVLPLGVGALLCSALALLGERWFAWDVFWLLDLEKPLHDALGWVLEWWLRIASWLERGLASWTQPLTPFEYHHALLYYASICACILGLLKYRQAKRKARKHVTPNTHANTVHGPF